MALSIGFFRFFNYLFDKMRKDGQKFLLKVYKNSESAVGIVGYDPFSPLQTFVTVASAFEAKTMALSHSGASQNLSGVAVP